jgi:hypothetical protein
VKVCSTTFLSLSSPKLLSRKYWFNWFSCWFSWYSNTCSTSFRLVQLVIKNQLNRFWTSSTGFDFGPPTGSAGHWTGIQSGGNWFSRFLWKKSKTDSFGAPPIYTHSYLSPPHKSTTQTPFLTWETPPILSHTPLASTISNLWREIFELDWRATIFVLHLQILLVLLDLSFGTTSSSLWIHYSWSL